MNDITEGFSKHHVTLRSRFMSRSQQKHAQKFLALTGFSFFSKNIRHIHDYFKLIVYFSLKKMSNETKKKKKLEFSSQR